MNDLDVKGMKQEFFYLLAYMLTSARGLYGEPSSYGIFRLLDSTGRLLEIMESYGLSDEYLSALKEKVDEEREGSMDEDLQRQQLDQMVLNIAEELQKRSGG